MSSCCPAKTKSITDDVKDYYGKKLRTGDDLETAACTTPPQKMFKSVANAMALIHDEVVSKYYGCGIVVPECLEDMNILDLGSGSGRDCYALSKLVGKDGFVIGIDMTDEQLEVANRHVDYHMKAFGFDKPNIKFVKGFIEKLKDAGIADNSVDIIVSNCVINLCKDKHEVLSEAYRVLKEGGELYFSDVYADRVLSDEIRNHKVLWGECVSGALHWKQLFDLAKDVGFETPRTFEYRDLKITKPDLKEVLGDAKFVSVMYRLFKLPKDADRNASQVIYKGTITDNQDELKFDRKFTFKNGASVTIDGDTAAILKQSRFKEDFMFQKAPGCAKYSEIKEENPFDLLKSGGVTNEGGTCCC
ncbi:arsenite methyltransferase-like [Clavelina lepadiformis]|uniref:arsenite methyltransferase-like n=1 Tax=Clavelina lepadiformis TaxID=159417 RepID=UPI0040413F95